MKRSAPGAGACGKSPFGPLCGGRWMRSFFGTQRKAQNTAKPPLKMNKKEFICRGRIEIKTKGRENLTPGLFLLLLNDNKRNFLYKVMLVF